MILVLVMGRGGGCGVTCVFDPVYGARAMSKLGEDELYVASGAAV